MKNRIRVGDIVRLRSGGPDMTVTCVTTDTGMVRCRWSASDGSAARWEFPARCLKKSVVKIEHKPLSQAFQELHDAGGHGWDDVDDPQKELEE